MLLLEGLGCMKRGRAGENTSPPLASWCPSVDAGHGAAGHGGEGNRECSLRSGSV